ncbi:hypothetical protein [Streptomyces triticiradicis]|uniref:Uncharacterized protein n=1 Tax=Streptomyces triticiradicis TaxID=2651189 RepID=A0A7J5D5B4_9ACTN|nr:hypothetical protein [Streptomyces triticiradicis]KAB1979452.1 hypothetical protein F8144_36165 [Streptomyces triticiradicis]
MAYTEEELRAASEQAGLPFTYLHRLMAAERDVQDPDYGNTLARQLTVVFDHYAAKCLAAPDPIAALREFGFEESADVLDKR